MGQNRFRSILSHCSGDKFHAPLSVFCCIAEKKSPWATVYFLRAHEMEHVA